jgi:hypothetical protein
MRRLTETAACLVSLALLAGCQSRPSAARSAAMQTPIGYIKRPAIDLSHGGAGFPVKSPAKGSAVPANPADLAAQVKAAYADRLVNGGTVVVTAEGDSPRRLDRLAIDLTGSTVKSELMNRTASPVPGGTPSKLHVRRLEYVADPLKYESFTAGITLEIDSADLAILPQTDGNHTLALYDCARGRARLHISESDLASGLLAVAKAKFKNNLTFGITGIDVRLQSDRSNTLAADVDVHARLLFVPATIRLHGRVATAGNNVLFTELEARGGDPGGAIAAGFVQEKLDSFNRKIARLLKLPGDKVHVTELAFRVQERLTIDVKFAGTKKPTSARP